jgi:hypothetical protein
MTSVSMALREFKSVHPDWELLSFPEIGNGTGVLKRQFRGLPDQLSIDEIDFSNLKRQTTIDLDVANEDIERSQHKSRFERWHYLKTPTYRLRYGLLRTWIDIPGSTIVEVGGYPNSVIEFVDKVARVNCDRALHSRAIRSRAAGNSEAQGNPASF